MKSVSANEVADLYRALLEEGVQLWLGGGWGVDALLQRETRPHKDLDALIAFSDLPALARSLSQRGFTFKEVWEENLWTPFPELLALIGRPRPANESEVATAFVLEKTSLELDIHVVRFDEHGRATPAWASDFVFSAGAFQGVGEIAGTAVRCLSVETQIRLRTGYALQEKDTQDLRSLRARFGDTLLRNP